MREKLLELDADYHIARTSLYCALEEITHLKEQIKAMETDTEYQDLLKRLEDLEKKEYALKAELDMLSFRLHIYEALVELEKHTCSCE